jgi:hypothetical protein
VLVASLVALWLCPARAAAGTPPARWERLAELVAPMVRDLEQLRAGGVSGLPDRRILARCAERAEAGIAACARGRRPHALGCAARLAATAVTLDAADRSTDAGAFTAFVGAETARVSTLLGTLERSRDACTRPAPDGPVPAILGWREGGAALEVEPAQPLAPGRRYRLALDPALAVARVEPSIDASGGLRAEPAPRATVPLLVEFGRRVGREAAHADGVTTRPTLVLRLAQPIPLAEVRSLSVAFEAIHGTAAPGGIVFRTVGDRLAPAPRAPAGSPPPETRLLGADERATLGLDGPALAHAAVRMGTFSSRDPATGATHRVPYLAALPAHRIQPGVVVLLLDGLGGNAARFLAVRGGSLLARGLALVTMDLPGHGMRKDGTPFLDPRDPSLLAGHLATGVADLLAFVAHLGADGALGPDVPSPTTIRVLAYSIGASVASVALAVEPRLDAAVLIAPPGDLADFLDLGTGLALGAPLLRCLAGATLGGPCRGGTCEGGACVLDPALLPLLASRTAVRTVVAAVDPQTRARAMAGPHGARPILLQIGGQDGIVAPDCTLWLAAALGADLTCTRPAGHPQVLCRFADAGHNVVWDGAARRQADAFLLSGGGRLVPAGEAWAAR